MPNAYRLLICDDDAILRDTLTEQLDLCDEFSVATEGNAADAIRRVSA
jgi:CheY-like chemotaxis protein